MPKLRLIGLDIVLVAALGGTIYFAYREECGLRRRETELFAPVKAALAPPELPVPKPPPVNVARYSEVAEKNLFASDRNPEIAASVEVPKPVPPLPRVTGVIRLPSGTKAIMAAHPGDAGRVVQRGDNVGDFRIAGLDTQRVEFDWEGRVISRSIDEMMDRSGATRSAVVSSVRDERTGSTATIAVAAGPGRANPGQTRRPCVDGDDSPIGAVVDGFRKVLVASSIGPRGCYWTSDK